MIGRKFLPSILRIILLPLEFHKELKNWSEGGKGSKVRR
jgi:hypothetical protein